MGFWSYVAPRTTTATRELNKKEIHPVRALCAQTVRRTLPMTRSRKTPHNRISTRTLTHFQEYVGRNAAASPAVGSTKLHDAEVAKLLDDAFAA